MERRWTEHHKITFRNPDGTVDYVWEADIPMREIIIERPKCTCPWYHTDGEVPGARSSDR